VRKGITDMKLLKYLPLAAALPRCRPWASPRRRKPRPRSKRSSWRAAVPTDVVFILNTLLFLIGGFLVFFMAAGFAMLEAGLVRSKNVTMQLTKNIGLFSLAAIFYYLIGYNLMYPLGDWGGSRAASRRLRRRRARGRGVDARPWTTILCLDRVGLLLPADVLRRHRLDRVGRAGRADQALAVPDLRRSS
jgi:hypothetical protein